MGKLRTLALALVVTGCATAREVPIADAGPCARAQDGAITIPSWLRGYERASRDAPPVDAGPCP